MNIHILVRCVMKSVEILMYIMDGRTRHSRVASSLDYFLLHAQIHVTKIKDRNAKNYFFFFFLVSVVFL